VAAVIGGVRIAVGQQLFENAMSDRGGANVPSGETRPSGIYDARVDRVVDGDTVVLDDGDTVRLIGVDTPEVVKPGVEPQCYGAEASALLKEILPAGTKVRVEVGVEAEDRYGRTLGYLWRVDDGVFINQYLLAGGYARVLTIEPNSKHASSFALAEAQARQRGLGLWGSC
jgi:micrococcal nuclease